MLYVGTYFKWPPLAGAAEKMKRLRPTVLIKAANMVLAKADSPSAGRPVAEAPKTKTRRQVPLEISKCATWVGA